MHKWFPSMCSCFVDNIKPFVQCGGRYFSCPAFEDPRSSFVEFTIIHCWVYLVLFGLMLGVILRNVGYYWYHNMGNNQSNELTPETLENQSSFLTIHKSTEWNACTCLSE